jgi:RNA polymerase sigma factor (sigma-70 family)
MDDGGEVRIPGCHVNELADFFAAHDRWLFGHACVRTRGDRELAADLVQDTFEAAARAWDMLREHVSPRQRAWLLATLAHKDISEFRHQEAFRRRQPDIHARYQPAPADTEATALNAIALARAREIIEDMPRRQREIALMRWQDHLRTTEIAARLGVAEGTVHAQLHTARRKLIAGLERYYPIRRGSRVMTWVTEPDDQRAALFVADFYPGLGAWLAGEYASGYDAVAGRARFWLWLAAHAGDGDALADNLTGGIRMPRLTREEESELATRVLAGRRAQERLAEGGWEPGDDTRGDLLWVAEDGALAGNRLLEANLYLVVSVAGRYADQGVPFPDLVREGVTGLIRAVQKYDRTKGYRFAPFATWWIRQEIARAVAGRPRATSSRTRDVLVAEPGSPGTDVLTRTARWMLQVLGREPSPEELAAELDLSHP